MFCRNCGREIDSQTATCPNCGAQARVPAPGVAKTTWLLLCLICLLAGLLIGGGAITLLRNASAARDEAALQADEEDAETDDGVKDARAGDREEDALAEDDEDDDNGGGIFATQRYNANTQAVASELITYGSTVVQYWKTPHSQGGAGQELQYLTPGLIGPIIGFNENINGKRGLTNPDWGKFYIHSVDGYTVTLIGIGNSRKGGRYPRVTTRVDTRTGEIQSVVDDVPAD